MADQLSGAGLAAASDIPSLDRLLNAEALQPATHVKDAHGYLHYVPEISKFVDTPLAFRAVRLSDGRELARLDFKDTCVGLPALQFERPGAKAASGSSPVIAFDDVPAWRANALELTQAQGRATLRLKPGVALPRKAGCNAS